ncbi:MAG: Ezrin/radixin/moesin family protein [Flexibacter sp. CG_4_10_14_3_um_filter_32_15]|nr:MAG: Ezrin/radixin/moesin family protein [Flexibacter sp. CG_4_10_14_3_um_filter_32_15]
MFRFILTTICLIFLLSTNSIFAQSMSKEQEKVWKKRQKSMSVEEFKKKVEGYETATDEAYKLEKQVVSTTQVLAERERRIDSLEQALADAQNGAGSSSNAENSDSDASSSDGGDNYSKGTVYRVQVGAFRNKDLMKFVGHRRFHAEEDQDGVKKYTIAAFRDYWEADLFKKYLREMGVNDAWIVSYKDGVRVQIESVLSAEDQEMVKSGGTKNDDID